jgi:hypothetical protein
VAEKSCDTPSWSQNPSFGSVSGAMPMMGWSKHATKQKEEFSRFVKQQKVDHMTPIQCCDYLEM